MSIDIATSEINELRDAIERLRQGTPNSEAAKKSLALLTLEREELRSKIGTIEVAVDLIRDVRDQ